MLKLKKSVTLLIALSLVLSVLLTGFSAPSATAKVDYQKLKPVNLTWYFVGEKQPDEALVYAAMNKITKTKINATVDFKRIDWAAYDEKAKLLMASGQEWDIIFTASWINNFYTAAAKGAFLDITTLIKKYPVLLKSVPDFCLASGTYNGKQYAIPNYQALYAQKAIVVPTSIAKAVGLDKIKKFNSINEWEPYLAKFKASYPDRVTLEYNATWGPDYGDLPALGSIKYNYHDKVPKLVLGFESPEVLALARKNREWFLKGYLRPDLLTSENKDKDTIVNVTPVLKPGMDGELLAQFKVPMTAIPFMDPMIV
ncbi:MAG: extracellular solute-binding protein, partial [Clostridiaceae bacterium]|nr:extracellular solute-binding protein [Clostridiaceae bacterium]